MDLINAHHRDASVIGDNERKMIIYFNAAHTMDDSL